MIVGNPDDSCEDVRSTFRYGRELGLDQAIVLCLQPYPKTRLRKELADEGLLVNPDDFTRYNGFMVNVRTRHLSARKLSRLIAVESLKLNFSSQYLFRSRLISRYRPFLLAFLKNSLTSFTSSWKNRMFESTHSF
jgi:hypothetical protein